MQIHPCVTQVGTIRKDQLADSEGILPPFHIHTACSIASTVPIGLWCISAHLEAEPQQHLQQPLPAGVVEQQLQHDAVGLQPHVVAGFAATAPWMHSIAAIVRSSRFASNPIRPVVGGGDGAADGENRSHDPPFRRHIY